MPKLVDLLSVSTRRHALQPFSLSDGTKVEVGDWVCTPVRAMMQNPEHYPEPLEFRGFRFVDPAILNEDMPPKSQSAQPTRASKLIDVNGSWHVWGTGRMAWYVTLVSIFEVTTASRVSLHPQARIMQAYHQILGAFSPGRYYASAVMKIMLAQVIRNYNCKLLDTEAKRWFTWRSSMLPKKHIKVIFTRRCSE